MDADCALFDLILRGELCEEVYYAEEKLIDGFEAALVAEDRKHSVSSNRWLGLCDCCRELNSL